MKITMKIEKIIKMISLINYIQNAFIKGVTLENRGHRCLVDKLFDKNIEKKNTPIKVSIIIVHSLRKI